MSKGDNRRWSNISVDEEELRWALATGKITKGEYEFIKTKRIKQDRTNKRGNGVKKGS